MDWSLEYAEARRLMGLRSTDLQDLARGVGFSYLRCPGDWAPRFRLLLDEIRTRRDYMQINPPR